MSILMESLGNFCVHALSSSQFMHLFYEIETTYLFLTWNLRYFIVKSCNRENLELSVQQGVWATQRSNESKLNEAFDSAENVILIFSVNRTRHFQVGLQIRL